MRIHVSLDGRIWQVTKNRIGELKNIDVSKLDMNAIYAEIDRKLGVIYENMEYEKDTAEAPHMILTKLNNGSYVMEYDVRVNVTLKSGGACSEDIKFIVKFE